jgi:hypothetical protein
MRQGEVSLCHENHLAHIARAVAVVQNIKWAPPPDTQIRTFFTPEIATLKKRTYLRQHGL